MIAEPIQSLTPEYAKRLGRRQRSEFPETWDLLDEVNDPELPGVSLWDLGVLQDIQQTAQHIQVIITLTYSGCPAVMTMQEDIISCLKNAYPGYSIDVEIALSPAWTTDAMSPEAKAKLKSIQITAPDVNNQVHCPLCNSSNTKLISQFGSTSCKALYQCQQCSEAFDYFKPL